MDFKDNNMAALLKWIWQCPRQYKINSVSIDNLTGNYQIDFCLISSNNKDQILHKELGNGFDLNEEIAKVARHYLERAMKESNNNRSVAHKLVGIRNYQTFTNWLRKYTYRNKLND